MGVVHAPAGRGADGSLGESALVEALDGVAEQQAQGETAWLYARY